MLGLLSDLKLIDDPKKRFIFQIFIILLFVSILDIKILSTRLDIVDLYLQNQYINYFFVVFCLMVFINGSNFIDGLNTLLITYIILILIILLIFFNNSMPIINNFYELIFILLFIFILNSFWNYHTWRLWSLSYFYFFGYLSYRFCKSKLHSLSILYYTSFLVPML